MVGEDSVLKQFSGLPAAQRERLLAKTARKANVSVEELKALLLRDWRIIGRPKQLPPEGEWTYWMLLGGRGAGKLLDRGTPIPTPLGWTALGDLLVGDLVFDESGRLCPILETFDATPDLAYRLRFSDGSTLDACSDHLWVTWDHAARKAYNRSSYEAVGVPLEWPTWRARRFCGTVGLPQEVIEQALTLVDSRISARKVALRLGVSRQALARHLRAGEFIVRQPRVYEDSAGPAVRTTQEIIDSFRQGRREDHNHSIPVCGALQLPERRLPLDPYVLGAWLGDGSANGGNLTAACEDHPHWYKELASFSPHPVRDPITVATYGLRQRLTALGLIGNKHVPSVYLRTSASQRLALLQGLMDTDGSAGHSGVEFTNTNERLALAVVELARSLGQKPVVKEGRARLNGRDCGPKWRVTWRPTIPVFRLERKTRRVRVLGAQAPRHYQRMIVDWERIDPCPMRCLTVASRHSMFLAGEAMIPTHNTLSGAQWAKERALEQGGRRFALVAPTLADGRDTMVEGESGLLSVLPVEALRGGNQATAWNRSLGELRLANRTRFKIFSSEEPDRLRGPQHHYVWCEEVSSWKDARRGDILETTWSNMKLGCRLGENPQICVTTTPKPNKLTTDILDIPQPRMVLVVSSSYENRDNLAEAWWEQVVAPYEGTRLGQQEIHAIVLEDVEGALWRLAQIDELRVDEAPPMQRVVVAVDPNVSSEEAANDAGIVVAGRGHSDRRAYVLADRTCTRGGPRAWAQAAVDAYHDFEADRIVAEKNNGGEMVELTIHTVDPTVPVKLVSASRGKRVRAEPVASLYEGNEANPPRARHVGVFPELESEMTSWTPEAESPNRMDALVWALTELMLTGGSGRPARSSRPQGQIPGVGERGRGFEDVHLLPRG